MGNLAMSARFNMLEMVLIPSILYNAEAFAVFTKDEMLTLERVQGSIIRGLLEVPDSTAYYPLLLETGVWTMESRIVYKKMMLYHHIMHSSDSRKLKQLILVQKEMMRKGSWYFALMMILRKYNMMDVDVNNIAKSTWKKMVKQRIQVKTEEEIRSRCKEMVKGRTVIEDTYERKKYLNTTKVEESKLITKMRLHMNKLPCNYGKGEEGCWLCGQENVSTEHYFSCPQVSLLRTCWNAKVDDMKSGQNIELLRASKFLNAVELQNNML